MLSYSQCLALASFITVSLCSSVAILIVNLFSSLACLSIVSLCLSLVCSLIYNQFVTHYSLINCGLLPCLVGLLMVILCPSFWAIVLDFIVCNIDGCFWMLSACFCNICVLCFLASFCKGHFQHHQVFYLWEVTSPLPTCYGWCHGLMGVAIPQMLCCRRSHPLLTFQVTESPNIV